MSKAKTKPAKKPEIITPPLNNVYEITLPDQRKVSVTDADDGFILSFLKVEETAEIRTRIKITKPAAKALVQLLGMHGVTWDQSQPIALTMEIPNLESMKTKKSKP